MSKGSSLVTFVAGGIIGAAAVYLTCTENGQKILKEGKKQLSRLLDEADLESTDEETSGQEI